MFQIWRHFIFGSKTRRDRFLRGLRLEMLLDRVAGDKDVVDEYLRQALRNVRPPITYRVALSRQSGEKVLYRYLRLPVARGRGGGL